MPCQVTVVPPKAARTYTHSLRNQSTDQSHVCEGLTNPDHTCAVCVQTSRPGKATLSCLIVLAPAIQIYCRNEATMGRINPSNSRVSPAKGTQSKQQKWHNATCTERPTITLLQGPCDWVTAVRTYLYNVQCTHVVTENTPWHLQQPNSHTTPEASATCTAHTLCVPQFCYCVLAAGLLRLCIHES